MQDGIVLAPTGTREALSTSQQYKVNLYFPVIDSFLAELNRRFSQENIEIMRAIHAFNPDSEHFLDPTQLKPIALDYNLDFELLSLESTLAKRTLVKAEMENVGDVFLELTPLRAAFPTLLKAIHIALTISVSTAQCERSFSALKRIKTYLRSTSGSQILLFLPLKRTHK